MNNGFVKKILGPKTNLGSELRKKRKQKNLSIKQVAKLTLIRYQYLLNLEKNHFNLLPAEPYGSFFVKRYADFLGLDGNQFVAWYQQESRIFKERSLVRPPEEIKFSILGFLRRRSRYLMFGVLAFLILISFLAYEVSGLTKGPYLKIVVPDKSEIVLNSSLFTIRGIANKEASISLNGTILDLKDGVFEQEVILKPGQNKFVLEAQDNLGKKTTEELLIWRKD